MFVAGISDPETWVDDVVQWVKLDDTGINRMKYENGRLTIEEEGIYYLYSKLEFNAAKKCDAIFHTMMKMTDAYAIPLELLRSRRYSRSIIYCFLLYLLVFPLQL